MSHVAINRLGEGPTGKNYVWRTEVGLCAPWVLAGFNGKGPMGENGEYEQTEGKERGEKKRTTRKENANKWDEGYANGCPNFLLQFDRRCLSLNCEAAAVSVLVCIGWTSAWDDREEWTSPAQVRSEAVWWHSTKLHAHPVIAASVNSFSLPTTLISVF